MKNKLPKAMIIIAVFLLLALSIAALSKTEIVRLDKLETKQSSKENYTKMEQTFTHDRINLGSVTGFQETDKFIVINFDSGWRVITKKERYDKAMQQNEK